MDPASKTRYKDASEIAFCLQYCHDPVVHSKIFWLMPIGNVPQWEKEKIRLEQDESLEK